MIIHRVNVILSCTEIFYPRRMSVTELQAKLRTAHENIFAMGRLTNEQLDALPLGALILYPEEPPFARLVCLKVAF
jgi:hypothetical protein